VPALILALSVLPVFAASPVLAQETAEEIYQAGLYQEEVQGNLERAIDLFGRILVRFPDNRAAGAKAQLHIGLCYEKLGQQEAQQAYRRVIAEFPDHGAEVAVARNRLAEIERVAAELNREPIFRKVEIASRPQNGVLSPDGSHLAFVADGAVWKVPLQGNVSSDMAGEPVRLTEPMGAWDMSNELAWSGDGKWIAFSAVPNDVEEIYVVAADGSQLKRIPGNHARGGHAYNFRLGLSPHGETLAFVFKEPGRGNGEGIQAQVCGSGGLLDGLSIHTVSVSGGDETPLTDNCTREPAFSPDGRYLAYTRAVDDLEHDTWYMQLWVRPLTGGTPILLVDSTQVRGPVWSSDGEMIAVIHEPGGGNESREVWVIPFSPEDAPVEPMAEIELPRVTRSLPAGWTPGNELGVHLVSSERVALYTVPAAGGKAFQITPYGDALFPRWTSDGRSIVFRGPEGLAVVPAEGGEIKPILLTGDSGVNPGIPPGGGVHVSPDGRALLFAGIRSVGDSNPAVEQAIWTVPIEGGLPTRVTRGLESERYPCWSPDGREIAFLRGGSIYVVPAQGGNPSRITSETDSVVTGTISYSPDGRWLAHFTRDGQLRLLPVDGGEARVVAEVNDAGRHTELAWSPDGRRIAYTSRGRLWVVPSEGGAATEIETGLEGNASILHFGWSPDGEKVVFRASTGGQPELWLISGFLPEEVGR
jgi:Tol biopolymer transport system component